MSSYQDEQNAIVAHIQERAEEYAAEFGRLTGSAWAIHRPIDDCTGKPYARFTLTNSGLMTVSIASSMNGNKRNVVCRPVLPCIPDGTAHPRHSIWRDWGFGTIAEPCPEPEAGVSWERYAAAVKPCAKRFVSLVVTPFAAVQPQIAERVARANAAYADRDSIAAALAERLGGSVHTDRDGKPRLCLPSDLPSATVEPGGYIRLSYLPTMTAFVFERYCEALRAEKASKGEEG